MIHCLYVSKDQAIKSLKNADLAEESGKLSNIRKY